MVEDFKVRFIISLILTIPILLLTPMIQQIFGFQIAFQGDIYLLFALTSILFFYGGMPFFRGCKEEVRAKNPGMMTLVAIAIGVAYVYGLLVVIGLKGELFFWELATLIDIMLLGHFIEMKSVMGAGRALEAMAALLPQDAHKLLSDKRVVEVPVHQLVIGDQIIVKPGEKIAADGEVVQGETFVDEAMLTGESEPVRKVVGSSVVGGAMNGEGSMIIRVTKTGQNSFLAQVMALMKQAQESKSRTQDIANRAAFWLTLVAIFAGLATLFIWFVFAGETFAFALERMVAVMVVTCPHALGLAIPLVVAVSTALCAQHGLFIRNRSAFEAARQIQTIVFDKTGTLTEGRFAVTDVIVLEKAVDRDELLMWAAAVESRSQHPIAQGIVQKVDHLWEVERFKSISGIGVEGYVKGRFVQVVSYNFLEGRQIKIDDSAFDRIKSEGKPLVFVLIEGKLQGAIALADVIRKEAKAAISELKKMGISCLMLTGDRKEVAKSVAADLGLDDYIAEVLPQDKIKKIQELQRQGLFVAMTGDGINDGPALIQADVGIAVGAGTDVAIESADIVLVRSNPADVLTVIKLGRATYRKMVQNLVWATGYNVIAIPAAAGLFWQTHFLMSPAIAAIFMSISTVIVAINATLLKVRK